MPPSGDTLSAWSVDDQPMLGYGANSELAVSTPPTARMLGGQRGDTTLILPYL